MHEFITPILDWLSTTHGSEIRGQYGWVTVLMVVIVAARHISQNEATLQRKCLKSKIATTLSEKDLSASAIVEKDNHQSKHYAKLLKVNNGYNLEIRTSSPELAEKIISKKISTIEELELYLSENTCFLLSDFK